MNAIIKLTYIESNAERLVLYALIAAVCSLCGLYFYFLSASVVHVVFSKEAEERMHQTHSDIATLEAAYMEKQNQISKEIVEHQGYIATEKKVFLNRDQSSLVTRR